MNESQVFANALNLADPVDRAAYLDATCAGDPELRAGVEALFRARDSDPDFLEQPAATLAVTADQPSATATVGATPAEKPGLVLTGRYKLLEVVGEGGMGTVWMAEQQEPVRRLVAVKLIRPGMDSKTVLARFEAERQALALMDHPNIAKVHDAGATADGRPYFVMELVKGVPITTYCDDHRLTPKQRLELFVPVCQAIQHAHQKGVIHRDVKPSNVLVARYDDRPVPKVIDFGVAKATGQSLTEATLHTGFGAVVGTVEYMSPEQATFNQLDIDTRSDIYSLGVLLYELLAGSPPFTKQELERAGVLEMLRVIREQEPSKPSTKLSTAVGLPTLAANRGTEPKKLTALLRSELDWIAMKALEKDRARRYETAIGFALDVQRYLADEPVLACPPSAAYRVRKFARRNKRVLVTATLVGVMLLVVAGSLGWITRDRAVQRGRNAEAVAALLDQCEEALRADGADRAAVALEAAERRAADGGAAEHGDRLARCRADLGLLRGLNDVDVFRWTWSGSSQPDQDEVVARWRAVLAEHGVTPDKDRAQEIADRIIGSPIRDRVLTALDWWSAAERSAGLRAVLKLADPDPFREAVRDAVSAGDRRAVAALADRSDALTQPARFAAVLGDLGGYPEERARLILESALRSRPADLTLLMTMGDTYPANQAAGAGERVRWAQAALAVQPTNPAVRNRLGIALVDHGKPTAAAIEFREALRLNPGSAIVHTNLGNALVNEGNLPGALAEFREAVRINPNDENAHNSLGVGLLKSDDLDGAVAEFREAIRLDPTDASRRKNLATALMMQEDWTEAAAVFREAIRLAPSDAYSFNSLGSVLDKLKDRAGAITAHREAVRLEPADVIWRFNLAVTLKRHEDLDGAIAEFRELLRRDPKHVRARTNLWDALIDKKEVEIVLAETRTAIHRDPSDAFAHYTLGRALNRKKDLTGAIAAFREAARLEPDKPRALRRLGRALADKGEVAGAVAAFRDAVRLDPKHAPTRTDLGNALADEGRGDVAAAIAEYRDAIRADPKYARAHGNLGSALFGTGNWKGAVVSLTEAVRLDPTDADYRSHLGGALFKAGDLDGALVQLQASVCLDPTNAQAHSNLGAVLCDGVRDFDSAIAAFRESIRLDPTDGTAHENLGNALKHKEHLAEAAAAYRQAARLEPTDAGVFNQLGWLLATGPAEVRDGKQAVADATRACELTKWKNPGYIDTLAAAYATAGDFAKAVEYQNRALKFPSFAKKHGKECGERLALYERKKSYRDPAHAPREPGPPPRVLRP